jgi:L-ascorbate 6-phosphate lactonase
MLTGRALIADIDACAPPPGAVALWWLGQHGFVLKLGTTIAYIDAYLAPHPDRRVPPLLRPDEITHADLVIGTHDHGDHIDRWAWPALAAASPQARFVVPGLLRARLAAELDLDAARMLGADDALPLDLGDIRLTGIAAAHELLSPDPATGRFACLGYVIEGPGARGVRRPTIYHAGDTCLYDGLQRRLAGWRCDALLLPINGRDARRLAADCIGNMTYQEAADLAGALQPRWTIPTHYDMFAFNAADPQAFADYMRVKYPRLAVRLCRPGERVILP